MSVLDRGLRPGDIAAMTACNVVFGDNPREQIRVGFKSQPRSRMVFMLLGEEARDGSKPLDVIQRLYDLGWSHPEFHPGDSPRENQ